jgi:hypothetical protein
MSATDDTGIAREAARQQALLAALWPPDASAAGALEGWCRDSPVTVTRGLQAYRANAAAIAARALEAAYPTVCALVGVDDFQQLASELWLTQPPVQGDLAQWGESLAAFLEAHAALADWPYLGDCARLDWAVHRCERAADVSFDAASIARLGDTDPQQLQLQLRPGLQVLASRWPVVAIHQAHREGASPDALAAARDALQAGVAESALVCRSGWRAQVHRIDAATVAWTQRLLAGDSLAAALDAVSDAAADESSVPPFDLAVWLSTALGAGWLKGITVAGD